MKWSPAIRINLASNILGDFNEDFLECLIHHGALDVVQKVNDLSGMSTFSQRAYRTSIMLAAGVMRDEFTNYYDVMTYLIGREQCIGFMTPEKLDHLLDSIVNCDYGQSQLQMTVGYYERWNKRDRLSPDEFKTLRMWMTRIARIRYDFKKNGWTYPPDWLQMRW
jgi:hypothetical protein